MKRLIRSLAAGGVLAAALMIFTGWCMVGPGEVVVVRRLGRLVESPWGPGLHWRLPLGIDRIERVRADAVRQVTIGVAGPDNEPGRGEAMTADLNLLRFQATIQYRVASPVDYVLRAERVEPILATAAEAGVTRAIAARGVDAVLRSERRSVVHEVERDLERSAESYQLGVSILSISLTDVRPPAEVEADFAAAQAAQSERDRRINEAKTYDETTTRAASAAAQAKLEMAHATARRTFLMAQAEVERFLVLLAQVERSRTLTMHRLYIDTMQTLMDGVKRKLVLPPGGSVDLTILGIKEDGPSPGSPEPRPSSRTVHTGDTPIKN